MRKVFGYILVSLAILLIAITSLSYYRENVKYQSLRHQRQKAIELKKSSGQPYRKNSEEEIDIDMLVLGGAFVLFLFSLALGIVMSSVGGFLILKRGKAK